LARAGEKKAPRFGGGLSFLSWRKGRAAKSTGKRITSDLSGREKGWRARKGVLFKRRDLEKGALMAGRGEKKRKNELRRGVGVYQEVLSGGRGGTALQAAYPMKKNAKF